MMSSQAMSLAAKVIIRHLRQDRWFFEQAPEQLSKAFLGTLLEV